MQYILAGETVMKRREAPHTQSLVPAMLEEEGAGTDPKGWGGQEKPPDGRVELTGLCPGARALGNTLENQLL
jgi:hypothetical protein